MTPYKPKDDERRARQQSAKDFSGMADEVASLGGTMKYYDQISDADTEFGDGDRVMIAFTIGSRGNFSRNDARISAKTWRKMCEKYPKAFFILHMRGYDDDPREIWEFEDARQCVRQWARFAGLDDLDAAKKLLVKAPDNCVHANGGLGFLAACGVFGDEMREQVLAENGLLPTSKQ